MLFQRNCAFLVRYKERINRKILNRVDRVEYLQTQSLVSKNN